MIDDNKECLPVASPKNVTETLAPGIGPDQHQFRQSIWSRKGLFRPGVNQFFGHYAAPLLHPALHGSQLSCGETIWVFRLQSGHQRLAGGIRFGLQPDQHVAPNPFEGILRVRQCRGPRTRAAWVGRTSP